jgi:hypothetical protein
MERKKSKLEEDVEIIVLSNGEEGETIDNGSPIETKVAI